MSSCLKTLSLIRLWEGDASKRQVLSEGGLALVAIIIHQQSGQPGKTGGPPPHGGGKRGPRVAGRALVGLSAAGKAKGRASPEEVQEEGCRRPLPPTRRLPVANPKCSVTLTYEGHEAITLVISLHMSIEDSASANPRSLKVTVGNQSSSLC